MTTRPRFAAEIPSRRSAATTEESALVRAGAACGALFVALALAGNSMTGSVLDPEAEPGGRQAVLDFTALGSSTAARLGVGAELLGMLAFGMFAAAVCGLLRGRLAGVAAAVLGTLMVAVKLGSGAPYLAGIANVDLLTPDAALALMTTNDAAFVLGWLPMGAFVVVTAFGLRSAARVGRPTAVSGVALGALAVLAGLVGAGDVGTANPVPFLLCLLWTAVVSVRLAVGTRS
jgi:hypothetical protein